MLLIALEQILDAPFEGFVTLGVFCFAIAAALTFHEFSHALSATLLGDSTARQQGRLSLNPAAHIEPAGAAMLLIVGFGWARPVPVDPRYLRSDERSGMAIVSAAGPLSNVLVATVAAIPINAGMVSSGVVGFTLFRGQADDVAAYAIGSLVFWNLLIASFNLIPLVPLDGFKLAVGLLPREASYRFAQLERYGVAPLFILIALGFVIPGGVLSSIIRPILNALSSVVLGGHIW